VEAKPTDAEGVLEVLVGTGDESIDRHRKVMHTHLRHFTLRLRVDLDPELQLAPSADKSASAGEGRPERLETEPIDRVPRSLAAPFGRDKVGAAQQLEMLRDRRLAADERRDELADAGFAPDGAMVAVFVINTLYPRSEAVA
jgi:hypothetical protein